MPKQLNSIAIIIRVEKNSDDEVVAKVTSNISLRVSEYPDMGKTQKEGNTPISSTIQDLATDVAENYLADTLIFEDAEDNIPVPVSESEPEEE